MNLYLIPTTYLNPIALINSNFKSNCITFSFGINPSDALNNARATLISLDLDIAAQYDLSPKCEMYLWIPENKIKNYKAIPQKPIPNDYLDETLERIYTNANSTRTVRLF